MTMNLYYYSMLNKKINIAFEKEIKENKKRTNNEDNNKNNYLGIKEMVIKKK